MLILTSTPGLTALHPLQGCDVNFRILSRFLGEKILLL